MTTIKTSDLNHFYCLVTGVSGEPISGYAGSLQSECLVNGSSVSTSVQAVSASLFQNLYQVSFTVNESNIGSGYLGLKTDDLDDYDVVPGFYVFDVQDNDHDSTYNLVRVNSATSREIATGSTYDRIITTVKEGSQWKTEVNISAENMQQDTDDLTGWSGFAFTVKGTESLTTSGGSILFTADSITVSSTADPAMIEFQVDAVPTNLIPESTKIVKLYGDLTGINPEGNKVILKNFQITLTRKFD